MGLHIRTTVDQPGPQKVHNSLQKNPYIGAKTKNKKARSTSSSKKKLKYNKRMEKKKPRSFTGSLKEVSM